MSKESHLYFSQSKLAVGLHLQRFVIFCHHCLFFSLITRISLASLRASLIADEFNFRAACSLNRLCAERLP